MINLGEERFFIFSCPSCNHLQIKEIRNMQTAIFKCQKCNKTRKVRSKGMFQLKYHGRFTSNQATKVIQELKWQNQVSQEKGQ